MKMQSSISFVNDSNDSCLNTSFNDSGGEVGIARAIKNTQMLIRMMRAKDGKVGWGEVECFGR